MEQLLLYVGITLIDSKGSAWKIFSLANDTVSLIELETTKIKIVYVPLIELKDLLLTGIIKSKPEDTPIIIDVSTLPPAVATTFTDNMNFIHEIHNIYGPKYIEFSKRCRKESFENLCKKYNFHITKGYRLIRYWLQSGLREASLIDHKHFKNTHGINIDYKAKTGKANSKAEGVLLNTKLRNEFDYGIEVFKSQRLVTIKEAFMRVLYNFYTIIDGDGLKLLPPDQRPTERQFRHYFSTKLSKAEIEKIQTSKREYRNNSRLLLGSPRDEAMRPGYILEADALEMDINIVSSYDYTQNISRPIIYMLVDIYSHAIVAFHVGFDNNSMLGLSSVMLNLFEDKETLLESKGLKADISKWPSRFIPNEIRCDRGSDFASNAFEQICKNLGISRTLETPAMGSMKGMIEQSFHQFHLNVLPYFEKYGVIQKRHDSNHKREAMLTLDDIFKMLVSFVIEHNTTYMKDIKLSQDMIRENIQKTPIAIWNYGIQKRGLPEQITPNNEVVNFYKLLPKEIATVSRGGIKLKGLYYSTNSDSELTTRMVLSKNNSNKRDVTGNKLNSMEVHYDPRSINHLYYIKDSKLQILTIIPSKCGDLKNITWEEYECYRIKNREMDKGGYEHNLENRITRITTMNGILEEAMTDHLAYDSNIRSSRKAEKNDLNFNEQFQTLFEENEEENLPQPQESKIIDAVTVEPEDNKEYSLLTDECPDDLFDF